jgi:hypothetical protein
MRLAALCETGGWEVGGGTGGVLEEILVKGGVDELMAAELCISVAGWDDAESLGGGDFGVPGGRFAPGTVTELEAGI